MQPHLSVDQAELDVSKKQHPKVTTQSIEAKISKVDYLLSDILTICIITMKNGFRQIGEAAPASPENFDAEIGKTFAYENAFKKLWPLEGYLLCEKLRGEDA